MTSVSAAVISANGVSEHGLIQDLGLRSDVRKACTRQHGGMIMVGELTKQVRHDVFVRSPRRSGLARVLTSMGATVRAEPGCGLSVTGMDPCSIASAAAAHYITNPGADAADGRRHLETSGNTVTLTRDRIFKANTYPHRLKGSPAQGRIVDLSILGTRDASPQAARVSAYCIAALIQTPLAFHRRKPS